jgi:hypothetical protein
MTLRRTRVRVGLALAALLFAAVVGSPAAPAHANSGFHLCFPVDDDGRIVEWSCVDIPVWWCEAPCGIFTIDPHEEIVIPADRQRQYLDAIAGGLNQVGVAALERDPGRAQRALDAAQAQFLAAARTLDGNQVAIEQVGLADLRANRVVPLTDSWLEAAGTDVGNGIWWMQRAVADPSPQPWISEGMRSFTSAYEHLATRR